MTIPGRLVGQVSTKLFTLKTLAEAGILSPTRPDRLVGLAQALLRAGLLAEKPSVGQRHVYLNPRRAAEIHRLIEDGAVPPGLRLP